MLSSQIEGTQSSLSDLLLFENEAAPGVPLDDVEETSNYIATMNHGLHRIESSELPLSNRLLREVHAVLMSGARGGDKAPGEFGAPRTGLAARGRATHGSCLRLGRRCYRR